MTWIDDLENETSLPLVRRRQGKAPVVEVPVVNTAGTPKPRKKRAKQERKQKEAPPEAPKTLTRKAARVADDPVEVTDRFFNDPDLSAWRGTIFIGIDTGKDGAIGYLYPEKPEITAAISIPMMVVNRAGKTKKGNPRKKELYDESLLWQIVQRWIPCRGRIVVAIEETQPRETDGGRTGHAMGYGLGMWPLFLRSHGFAVELILPATWKRRMGLCNKDKEWSRLMAQRNWPLVPLFRKKDEGRAEALLVAECIRRGRQQ